MLIVDNDPGRNPIYGLAESQTKVALTLAVAMLEHTLAPTGKYLGPEAGALLSRPTTSQVTGVTVSAAWTIPGASKAKAVTPKRATKYLFMTLARFP
jgi:hypothetical protein